MNSRRNFLRAALALGAGAAASSQALAHEEPSARPWRRPQSRGAAGVPLPVATPDVSQLPHRLENGVKVFQLVAEPVKREIYPGKVVDLWGYNGSVPGPTIQVTEGDRVRIIVENRLPEPTSMHWHGFEIPVEMDGMPAISQPLILPGEKFVYEFTLHQAGTFFYHSHMSMQEMMGMIGMFIMHPKEAWRPRVDRDFGFVLQEFAVLPNASVPNSLSMEFNWLTMNGKAAPATTPILVKRGERVRLRFVNMGMDHHPVHVHGHTFVVTGSEAGRQPESLWGPKNTTLVGVAEATDVEFVADNPGDWMVHCHLPHHMMNQMASMTGPLWTFNGMAAGLDMKDGMGMLRQGHATAEGFGPSLGRGMGVGSEHERATTDLPLQAAHAHHGGGLWKVAPGANRVPGFPQDHFPVLDELVAKPETYGLAKGWSGAMMGMMTLLRVLEPEMYDKIHALRQEPAREEHKHG